MWYFLWKDFKIFWKKEWNFCDLSNWRLIIAYRRFSPSPLKGRGGAKYRLFDRSAFLIVGFLTYRLFDRRLFAYRLFALVEKYQQNIGFLTDRLFDISAFWHIGFLHLGFLFYRIIDIGFLTVGFLRSADTSLDRSRQV
jgi:hypothetical protein